MIWQALRNRLGTIAPKALANALSARTLEQRILAYRTAGSDVDGLRTLSLRPIDDLDYRLMGADNSAAAANHPTVGPRELRQFLLFAIDQNSELSKRQFGNSHGISHDGGKTFRTETALLDIPKLEYQASPEEVVWQLHRVDELRAQDMPQAERMRVMTAERAEKPWRRR